MNLFVGMGRLTRDPDVRYTQSNGDKPAMAVARYTLAIDRYRQSDGQPGADFLSCVAFGKNAEFAEKYLRQGIKIVIKARVMTGSYTNKEGQKVYTTDFVIESQEFAESKSANGNNANPDRPNPNTGGEFMNIPDGVEDEGLPFN